MEDYYEDIKYKLGLEKRKNILLSYIIKYKTNFNLDTLFEDTNIENCCFANKFVDNCIPCGYNLCEETKTREPTAEVVEISTQEEPPIQEQTVEISAQESPVQEQTVEISAQGTPTREQTVEISTQGTPTREEDTKRETKHEDKISIKKKIEGEFKSMENGRYYRKTLKSIKKLRTNLTQIEFPISLEEYTKVIQEHISTATNILLNKKKCKKIEKVLNTVFLSPLEKRLVKYGDYVNTSLPIDFVEIVRYVIRKNLVATDISNFGNYGCVLLPIYDIIEIYMNKTQIYCFLQLSENPDPKKSFRFYRLEKTENNIKNWIMDCRLERFEKDTLKFLEYYMIKEFRKLYYDVYADNIYRQKYRIKSSMLQCDTVQLLINLFDIQRKKFGNKIREYCIKYCSTTDQTTNRFNILADDVVQKHRYEKRENGSEENLAKLLFDNITEKEINIFLQDIL